MYLEKLEIQGFKSFANRTVLEFDQGITAIVGPNGSGKSNIADAVRWALGEQSLKTLRGKKSRDVIFSGSGKKARLGMAEVSIFINNKAGRAPIDYSELVITRRIYQNGEGEYFINRNRVRLQDILLLIAKANFGQKSYSVIGQGMIESVLTSSPQERKEFFDEAAGVKQYQIKREQADLKLTHTQENLNQAEILVQEIAPRLRSLTRQVRRLERREKIETELRNLQRTHYYLLWKDLDHKYSDLQKKYQENNSRLEKIESEKEKIQAKINLVAQEDTRTQLFQKYQEEYQAYQQEKNKLLQEQVVLKGKTELEYIQKGRGDIAWLEKKRSELEQTEQNVQKEIEATRAKYIREKDLLEQQLQEQKRIIEEFSQLEKALEEGFEKWHKKPELDIPFLLDSIEKIYLEQKELWEKLEKVQAVEEISKMRREANSIIRQLESLRNQLRNIQTNQDFQDLPRLQKKLSNLLKTKDNLVNEINNRKIRTRSMEEKLHLFKKETSNIQEELKKIEQELKLATIPGDTESRKKVFQEESAALQEKLEGLERKIITIQQKLNSFNKEEQVKKDDLLKLQREMQRLQQQSNEITNQISVNNVEIAKIETKREDLEKEINENRGLDELRHIRENQISLDSEIKKISDQEREETIKKYKHQLELIGGIDPAIQEEYQTTSERHNFLTAQIGDLKKASRSLEKVIEELDEKIKKQFNDAFKKINHEFSRYFKLLFDGGKASLALRKEEFVTPEEELEEAELNSEEQQDEATDQEEVKSKFTKKEKVIAGIEIQACPPGKKLSDLNMLSGGEKALTSIALIYAIIASNPPPFAILDEVDAALDEANSIKYAKILEDLAHKTQFITITHNRATMHQAAILYGVTMGDDGISKLLSVKMEDVGKIGEG